MRYCEKCGVHVIGSPPCCPLCQGPLTGEADGNGNVYPDIPFAGRPHQLLFRLLALGTVIAMVLCTAAFLCLPEHRVAALSGIAGLASGWLTVGIAFKKRGRPLKAVFWQVCVLSILVLAWDHGMGWRGWSLNYVLPVLYTCTMLAMAVIARLLHLRPSDYLLYLLLNILLGLIPLVLLLCGLLRTVYPAVICAAVSVIFLAVLILFEGPALKGELLRRLHL
ncbi:DUF6320 domain-containing protein [uncultured Dysosmobacter sp.]|uniref:DUF6320 domain-containing protein n=1 Tax=uncultured Dysosmobacter sp. TaxID=2591384 RepID=UPI00262C2D86|nr:DUF6320 domain-containing protein [uncultured Dysosmobacter sp.]